MNTETAKTLSTDDIDTMTSDERWGGWGYLGERSREDSPETVALVDAHVIELANAAGLTYDELFEWANSKDGRWYGDMTWGQATGYAVTTTFAQADKYGPR